MKDNNGLHNSNVPINTSSGNTSEHTLKYCTRGNSDPYGKSRVFIACHPGDFSLYVERIIHILHEYQNCVIYYENPEEPVPWQELVTYLYEMQLIVVPITTRFLTQNSKAMDSIIPFAEEKHIPILPLMMESGLDTLFEKKYGNVQYLYPENRDLTAIPFEKKVEKFLFGVLVGDEEAQKVRGAFTAKIFLSYRKKDRNYALESMNIIHNEEKYSDIAIWYDEYLIPGEDFNESILSALNKSDLFMLIVTPSLLEKDNYIMRHEFPSARDLGKKILPAKMVDTDGDKLEYFYKGIPELVDVRNKERLEKALENCFKDIEFTELNNNPQRMFLIGLAYMEGIDVETNREKAADLITRAAKKGNREAIKKLVYMYHNGKAVPRDYQKSIQWQRKLVSIYSKEWEKSGEQADLSKLINELDELGDALFELKDFDNANKTVLEVQKLTDKQEGILKIRNFFICYIKLGTIEGAKDHFGRAKELYEKGFEKAEEFYKKAKTNDSRRNLEIIYGNLGRIEEKLGHPYNAIQLYENSLNIAENLWKITKNIDYKRDLLVSYSNLGRVEAVNGRFKKAIKWLLLGLETANSLSEESKSELSLLDLWAIYNDLGSIEHRQGHLPEAQDWYEKGHEIIKDYYEKTNTLVARRELSVSYSNLGEIETQRGNSLKAKEWYKKSIEIKEELANEIDTVETKKDMCIILFKLGGIEMVQGNSTSATNLFKRGLEIANKVAQESDSVLSKKNLAIAYNLLAESLEANENIPEAKRYYEKGYELTRKMVKETEIIEGRKLVSVFCSKLGRLEEGAGIMMTQ